MLFEDAFNESADVLLECVGESCVFTKADETTVSITAIVGNGSAECVYETHGQLSYREKRFELQTEPIGRDPHVGETITYNDEIWAVERVTDGSHGWVTCMCIKAEDGLRIPSNRSTAPQRRLR